MQTGRNKISIAWYGATRLLKGTNSKFHLVNSVESSNLNKQPWKFSRNCLCQVRLAIGHFVRLKMTFVSIELFRYWRRAPGWCWRLTAARETTRWRYVARCRGDGEFDAMFFYFLLVSVWPYACTLLMWSACYTREDGTGYNLLQDKGRFFDGLRAPLSPCLVVASLPTYTYDATNIMLDDARASVVACDN